MNVFVLCTGRSGSNTFARACAHASNFTAGHETRSQMVGEERLNYPDNHIEADNYLAWFLGRLDARYGDEAYYVHLTRDPEAVAKTWSRWWSWQGSQSSAYRNALLKMTDAPMLDCCRDYVDTKTQNIEHFLKDKTHQMTIRLEEIEEAFPRFWEWVGAEGDFEAAMGEWRIRHNATPSPLRMKLRILQNTAGKILRCYR